VSCEGEGESSVREEENEEEEEMKRVAETLFKIGRQPR
jgi:hypothetical protein